MKNIIFVFILLFQSVSFCGNGKGKHRSSGKEVKTGDRIKLQNGGEVLIVPGEADRNYDRGYKYEEQGSTEWPTPSPPAPVGDTKKSDWW